MQNDSWKKIALEFFNYNKGKNNELYVVEKGRCIETEWQCDFVAMCEEVSEIVNIKINEEVRSTHWKDIAVKFFVANKVQDITHCIKVNCRWQIDFVIMCEKVTRSIKSLKEI